MAYGNNNNEICVIGELDELVLGSPAFKLLAFATYDAGPMPDPGPGARPKFVLKFLLIALRKRSPRMSLVRMKDLIKSIKQNIGIS